MSDETFFHPHHNALQDALPPPPLPSTFAPSYIETYLAYRTRPRFRCTPHNPYTALDVTIFPHLLECKHTAASLLDTLSLYPPYVTSSLLSSNIDLLTPVLPRLALSLSRAISADDLPHVLDCMDTLVSVAHAGGVDILIEVLSTRNDRSLAADKVRSWLREARETQMKGWETRLVNGLSGGGMLNGLGAMLIDALLGIPLVEVKNDEIVRKKGGGRKEGEMLGKRTDRRKKKDVEEIGSFGGEGVDVDWYRRRIMADEVREEDEREQMDSEKRLEEERLMLEIYNDDPDEGELEGEVPLKEVGEEAEGEAIWNGGRGRGRGRGMGRGRGRGRGGQGRGGSRGRGGGFRGRGANRFGAGGRPGAARGSIENAAEEGAVGVEEGSEGSIATEVGSRVEEGAIEGSVVGVDANEGSGERGRGRGRGVGRGGGKGRHDYVKAGRVSTRSHDRRPSGKLGGGSPAGSSSGGRGGGRAGPA